MRFVPPWLILTSFNALIWLSLISCTGFPLRLGKSQARKKSPNPSATTAPAISSKTLFEVGSGDGANVFGWEIDPRRARKQARRSYQYMLVYINDSRQHFTTGFEQEVINQDKFRALIEDDVLPVHVNFGNQLQRDDPFYKRFKEKLNVQGLPQLILFDQNANELWRHKGYQKGLVAGVADLLEEHLKTARKQNKEELKALKKRGFRRIRNLYGKSVFAKVLEVKNFIVTLKMVDGSRSKTHLAKLHAEDREEIRVFWLPQVATEDIPGIKRAQEIAERKLIQDDDALVAPALDEEPPPYDPLLEEYTFNSSANSLPQNPQDFENPSPPITTDSVPLIGETSELLPTPAASDFPLPDFALPNGTIAPATTRPLASPVTPKPETPARVKVPGGGEEDPPVYVPLIE